MWYTGKEDDVSDPFCQPDEDRQPSVGQTFEANGAPFHLGGMNEFKFGDWSLWPDSGYYTMNADPRKNPIEARRGLHGVYTLFNFDFGQFSAPSSRSSSRQDREGMIELVKVPG